MAVIKQLVFDGNLARRALKGDVVAQAELIQNLTTVGSGTLTATLLTGGIINRTGPAGAFNETTDTAANIIAALSAVYNFSTVATAGNQGGNAAELGMTWRMRYINTVAFIGTLVAGTGVTLAGNTVVNASSVKDFLLEVTNGTQSQVYAASTTNASAVITGMTQAQTNSLSVGMAVSGTGIAASSVIISIQPGLGVTLNNNATATATLVAVTFSPTVTITGLGQGLL